MWEFMRRPALSGPKVLILDFGTGSLKTALVQIDLEKRFGYISAYAKRSYQESELKLFSGENQAPFDFEELLEVASGTMEEVFRIAKSKTKEAMLVLTGAFIRGEQVNWKGQRANAGSRLSDAEFQEILVNTLRRAKEDLAQREQGQFSIVNGMLQRIKLDGYVVANPVDFKGKELEFSNFLFLLSEVQQKFWRDAVAALKLELHSIVPSLWATMRSQMRHALTGYGAVFIDIGGTTSDLLIVRDSIVETMRTIPFGAELLAQEIAKIFKTDVEEAQRFQTKYEQGVLDEASVRKIETGLRETAVLLRSKLVEALQQATGSSALPNRLIFAGGGLRFGLLNRLLTQYAWQDELPFSTKPQVEVLLANEIKDVIDLTKQLSGPEFVPLLASARWISRHYKTLSKAEHFFEGAIKLMED